MGVKINRFIASPATKKIRARAREKTSLGLRRLPLSEVVLEPAKKAPELAENPRKTLQMTP
ncbi:hypothetical protein [Hornefia butyriciproducens]|uniref:hypothetical protein n=1 Tax=Hornefia butyriciproducens TaxID=2652293 RepID=UPI002A90D412|nr:hypothetical protein [Hornefia butyriciproducens]